MFKIECSSHLTPQQEARLQVVKIGAAVVITALVIFILVYSIATHACMDRLVNNPALAQLTKQRFFHLLAVTGTMAFLSALVIVAAQCRQRRNFFC